MAWHNIVTSIDIGSSKIRTIIWYFDEQSNRDNYSIIWVWIASSNAIRKWNILDMEEFKNNLDKSLEEAEKMAWEQIVWAYISFNSSTLEVIKNKWVVAVIWWEINEEDIERAIDMSRSGVDLPNKEILKVIPEEFIVDIEEWVKNPVWMSARKLEVISNIFSMNANVLSNIRKAVTDIWIEIYDIYPNLLSNSEWILTKRQKELWVVCIDIGASVTGISVFEEWNLIFSSIIPIWWDSVTNDIALWLRTSTQVAEKLKIDHAELWLEFREDYVDEEMNLSQLNIWEEGSLSLLYLSKIATARYEEIFYFIREELKKVWKDGMLPEWAVCVWWWAKVRWFVSLWKKVLKLPTFIWLPINNNDYCDASINDPVFASVLWTMILSNKYSQTPKFFSFNLWWFFKSIARVFKKILP